MSAGEGLARLLGGLRSPFARLVEPRQPLVAIEIRSRALGLVRVAPDHGRLAVVAAAGVELAEGVLRPSPTEPNVRDAEALRRALEGLASRAGIPRGADVALVLPDGVARVALLPSAELRGGSRELDELIRFRLRKSVPFEIREAVVASLALPPAPGREAQTLAGAISRPVLEGYEAAARAAGMEPGVVELSGLALLRAASRADAAGDLLLVNWDEDALSLLLEVGGRPALVRTLSGELLGRAEEVAREIANTVLYYRDRLSGAGLARALVRCVGRPEAEALALLREPLGLEPEPLDVWGDAPGAERVGPRAALAAAAANVLARAA